MLGKTFQASRHCRHIMSQWNSVKTSTGFLQCWSVIFLFLLHLNMLNIYSNNYFTITRQPVSVRQTQRCTATTWSATNSYMLTAIKKKCQTDICVQLSGLWWGETRLIYWFIFIFKREYSQIPQYTTIMLKRWNIDGAYCALEQLKHAALWMAKSVTLTSELKEQHCHLVDFIVYCRCLNSLIWLTSLCGSLIRTFSCHLT